MAIVGGFDIYRKQITFDYLDTGTGQVRRGRIDPACRQVLRSWLDRFAGRDDVTFAVEGCTGWLFVVQELQRAGITALLAEPAETAHLRGPKMHAKTDKADSRHLRTLVADGKVPASWIPPEQACELRALLQLYRDLSEEHTAWPAHPCHVVPPGRARHGAPAQFRTGARRAGQRSGHRPVGGRCAGRAGRAAADGAPGSRAEAGARPDRRDPSDLSRWEQPRGCTGSPGAPGEVAVQMGRQPRLSVRCHRVALPPAWPKRGQLAARATALTSTPAGTKARAGLWLVTVSGTTNSGRR